MLRIVSFVIALSVITTPALAAAVGLVLLKITVLDI